SALGREDVDYEDEGRIAWDGRFASLFPVALVRWDDEDDLAADLLSHEAFVPAVDDLSFADRVDGEGLSVLRPVRVERLRGVVPEPAGVLHRHALALLDLGAFAFDGGVRLQLLGLVAL